MARGDDTFRTQGTIVELAIPKEARIVIDLTAMGEPIIHPAPAAG